MPGYAVRKHEVHLGGRDYRIRSLLDTQQYSDRDGLAEKAGISPANWPLFGQLWPASKVLAQAMSTIELDDRRILEIGCGLGLPSLVLQQRGADITASDRHPLAEQFLQYNAALNELPDLAYHDLCWVTPDADLGRFDLIIASDVLYERDHAAQLVALLARHARAVIEVIVSDPGRGNRGPFTRAMKAIGYLVSERDGSVERRGREPARSRLISYRRN